MRKKLAYFAVLALINTTNFCAEIQSSDNSEKSTTKTCGLFEKVLVYLCCIDVVTMTAYTHAEPQAKTSPKSNRFSQLALACTNCVTDFNNCCENALNS